ncbi:Calmodulin-interacting protein 111 [Apostasia shenzhenica]|uniref:Calmodulin-interacting protein 111 n=1 Tax=Apostasia shenzhenica TaxID=1088818 RepID=A0A2I0B7A4_9ASPA|nr:Calmodulin-interacting protein 111 [Apostasia shenzhenica]
MTVSLATSRKQCLDEFPLESFVEGCAINFGIDVDKCLLNKPGCYFAIATILPSTKVQKNGVRLSWALTCTMGFPAIGKALFIFPFGGLLSSGHISTKNGNSHLYLQRSKELKLIPLPQSAGEADSPIIPCYASEVSFPVCSPFQLKKFQGPAASVDSSTCLDASALKLALADEKMKVVLENYASRWLYGRYLLHGNPVAVPICGQIWIFLVESTDGSTCQEFAREVRRKMLSCVAQTAFNSEEDYFLLLVEAKTKVSVSGPTTVAEENPYGNVFSAEYAFESTLDKELSEIPQLGGLSNEYATLKEIIQDSLENMGQFPRRCKGVVLHGPLGAGKTTLVWSCAHDTGVHLLLIGPEIFSQCYGESEQALCDIFDSARKAAPSVVFIDQLEAVAPARKDGGERLSLGIVTTLLKLVDDIRESDGILVIAATNSPDNIDPALCRRGRLDRVIKLGVPTPLQRLDILHTLLNEMDHSLSNKELESLAFCTHGFVGADLAGLCTEAAMNAVRRYSKYETQGKHLDSSSTGVFDEDNQDANACKVGERPSHSELKSLSSLFSELTVLSGPVGPDKFKTIHESDLRCCSYSSDIDEKFSLKIIADDFENANMNKKPCVMREVKLEIPKVRWEDVGGQREIKRQLIEAVQWLQIRPDPFKRMGIPRPKGILMIGPPGCSKTLMARAVAFESRLNFLSVKGPELYSKWVGDSEKAVRSIFEKARANCPTIIFFDEIDGLAVTRGQENDGTSVTDRVVTQLLLEMDGLDERVGVIVIAATNRPDKIDPALLRPGRFDRILDVQPPDEMDREDIFQIHTRNMACSADVSFKELASLTMGYTGADIKLVCDLSIIAALEESLEISEISMKHFRIAVGRVSPSEDGVTFYEPEQFRRFVPGGSARVELPEAI